MLDIFQRFVDENIILYTSAITFEEYEVLPLKKYGMALVRDFEAFINDMEIHVVNIDRSIAGEAAVIRAKYPGFKAMDSLQIAAAIGVQCDLFLANDKQLRQAQEIMCKTLDEIEL